jgi:hypothetical protein
MRRWTAPGPFRGLGEPRPGDPLPRSGGAPYGAHRTVLPLSYRARLRPLRLTIVPRPAASTTFVKATGTAEP